MNRVVKRVAYWLGTLLALSGLGFVGHELYLHTGDIDLSGYSVGVWALFGLLAFAYGLSGFLLARAWVLLLRELGQPVGWPWAARIYGLAQLAKYAPGNVFHLAGRQAMGMAEGLPAGTLARSTIWELAGQAAVAGVCSALALPLLLPALPQVVALGLLCFGGTTLWLLLRYLGRTGLVPMLVYQTMFLMAATCSFLVVLWLVTDQMPGWSYLPSLIGAFVLAWVVGFVTPGAPGGIGVRELLLVFLLGGVLPEQDIVLAVVLSRVLTTLGDLVFFSLAFMIPRRFSP